MAYTVCENCGNRPIQLKKKKLCSRCYLKEWRREKIEEYEASDNKQPDHKREIEFAASYRGRLLYQPAVFKLAKKTVYIPDFYDIDRDVFIEVVGTRQAYSANRKKYQTFMKTYPNLKLEFVFVERMPRDRENIAHVLPERMEQP